MIGTGSEPIIRYSTFPKTEPPPLFAEGLVGVFRRHEKRIATEDLEKGLTSDGVLATLAKDLTSLGFTVETGKTAAEKIERPVFFGENGKPSLRYQCCVPQFDEALWEA